MTFPVLSYFINKDKFMLFFLFQSRRIYPPEESQLLRFCLVSRRHGPHVFREREQYVSNPVLFRQRARPILPRSGKTHPGTHCGDAGIPFIAGSSISGVIYISKSN